jgi:hypothetical protein
MSQEVKYLKLSELRLWTENPRHPIESTATDEDIINLALENQDKKWDIASLSKKMGDYYDFSELPTVVYHGKIPVVYDGNRRVIIGKIKLGLVKLNSSYNLSLPFYPDEIPCNVCTREIALKNILRKHSSTGNWTALDKDIFLHKFMNQEKSNFLIFEEYTGMISSNPHLNQGFVKSEILSDKNLKAVGFEFKGGNFLSKHTIEEIKSIFSDISSKVKNHDIYTRGENRGKLIEVLDPTILSIIDKNKDNKLSDVTVKIERTINKPQVPRLTKRMSPKLPEIFGGKLYLRQGDVSDLHRDIMDLYYFYAQKKDSLSNTFPNLIRMSLRLLWETAAGSTDQKMRDNYIRDNFVEAKSNLDKEMKTSLSSYDITSPDKMIGLLHIGAHNYKSSSDFNQTLALSLMIGAILNITHGKTT